MTTPRVTEMPLVLAAVEPDPFVDRMPPLSVVPRRQQEARMRHEVAVRREMRARFSDARSGPRTLRSRGVAAASLPD